MTITNKDDAIKIKKLLGLNGDESQKFGYYNVTDVLTALMHFCDYALELGDEDRHNLNFESSLYCAREGYESLSSSIYPAWKRRIKKMRRLRDERANKNT